MKARYLVLSEYSAEDRDLLLELDAVYQTERAKSPDKYPKYVVKTSNLGAELPKLTQSFKILDVYEVDDPEQLTNYWAHWSTNASYAKSYRKHIIPLQDFSEVYLAPLSHMRQQYEKTKEQSKTSR
jgi:hypothetical protein